MCTYLHTPPTVQCTSSVLLKMLYLISFHCTCVPATNVHGTNKALHLNKAVSQIRHRPPIYTVAAAVGLRKQLPVSVVLRITVH